MTKKERAALQGLVNRVWDYREKASEAFDVLMEENKKVNGTAWCCAAQNHKELLAAGKDFTKYYDRYVKYNAIVDAISELGCTLAELDFWKFTDGKGTVIICDRKKD